MKGARLEADQFSSTYSNYSYGEEVTAPVPLLQIMVLKKVFCLKKKKEIEFQVYRCIDNGRALVYRPEDFYLF